MISDTIHSPHNWAQTAANIIAEKISEELASKPHASLVVPGGRTAMSVLPFLAKQNLPWGRIAITMSDERWVNSTHPDSNKQLIQKTLLNNGADGATFTDLKTNAAHPQQALSDVHERLSVITRPFSVVFLGIGEDGHFASIFPQTEILQTSLCVLAVDRPDHARMSLTPSALLDSQAIVLVATGAKKVEVLNKARTIGSTLQYPIRHILHQTQTPVTIVTG